MRCGAQCWLISRADNRQKKREGGQRGSGLMKKHQLSASWAEAAAATAATWCCLFCLPACCLPDSAVCLSVSLPVYPLLCHPSSLLCLLSPFVGLTTRCTQTRVACWRLQLWKVFNCEIKSAQKTKLPQLPHFACHHFLPSLLPCPSFSAYSPSCSPLPSPLFLFPSGNAARQQVKQSVNVSDN